MVISQKKQTNKYKEKIVTLQPIGTVVHKYGRRRSGRGPPNNSTQKSAMIFLNDNKGVLVK